MRRTTKVCILALVLCLSIWQCAACAFGRKSADILPHLISQEQAEQTPVRPIDGCEEVRDFTKQTEAEQLDELLQIVYKPWRSEGAKPNMETALPAVRRVYASARAMLDRYIRNDFDAYERIHAIHDWLAYTVAYDFDLATSSSADPAHPSFGLLGVFDAQKAVCDGFSKAMLLLCGIEQIPCIRVTGEYNNQGDRIAHAWNKVNIGGSWYQIDATMDSWHIAADKKTYHLLNHGYFLCSDEEMREQTTGRHIQFGKGHEIGEGMFVDYACPSSYPFHKTTALGIGSHAMEITSQAALDDVFAQVYKSDRKIGKLELKLTFADYDGDLSAPDAYAAQIAQAFRKVKNADFGIDVKNQVYPYMRYPRGVFVIMIYT